jgi:hypothetical protein
MTGEEARQYARVVTWQSPGFEIVGGQTCTSATTLTSDSGRLIQLDASGAPFTLTFPPLPYVGMTFLLSEIAGSVNFVTVDGNGKNINGNPTMLMNGAYRQRHVRYNGVQWIVVGGLL